jgi:hypothetical protein
MDDDDGDAASAAVPQQQQDREYHGGDGDPNDNNDNRNDSNDNGTNNISAAEEYYKASGCCKRVLYAMCLGLKSTEGNAGDDNNDDDTPLIDLQADPWRIIRKREIKADQKELVAEIMRRFLAYHNSVGRLPPRAAYYSVTKCIQWLLDRPITLLADVLFLRQETNRYRQTILVARMPPVAPMDDDDDIDAAVSAAADHNGTNTISAAEEYYTASGCCKRVLFAMCLGLTKKSNAGHDDDDTPLIYLEVDPWRTVRKSEIKAGRKELAAEIQRRSLTYHPAEKIPRVTSYSMTKCFQWLLDHPIPCTTDVLFLRHETNRYRRTIILAMTTPPGALMLRRGNGDSSTAAAIPRQYQTGLCGAAPVAPREEEGEEGAPPVATTNHHHRIMIPPTTNHPTRLDDKSAHDDDDDDNNKNNSTANIAAAGAAAVAPDATAACGGPTNAEVTLPAVATIHTDRLARRQSPCLNVNDSSSSSSDDCYDDDYDEDDEDDDDDDEDDDLRRLVVAMVTAVSALIGTRRRRRRDRNKSRRLLYVRQRLDQLRDQSREYRRDAVMATADDENTQEYKAFCDREVAAITKEMEDLQQERERLEERSKKKKQKTRHNET